MKFSKTHEINKNLNPMKINIHVIIIYSTLYTMYSWLFMHSAILNFRGCLQGTTSSLMFYSHHITSHVRR